MSIFRLKNRKNRLPSQAWSTNWCTRLHRGNRDRWLRPAKVGNNRRALSTPRLHGKWGVENSYGRGKVCIWNLQDCIHFYVPRGHFNFWTLIRFLSKSAWGGWLRNFSGNFPPKNCQKWHFLETLPPVGPLRGPTWGKFPSIFRIFRKFENFRKLENWPASGRLGYVWIFRKFL